jgi:hypothetical protein
MVIPRTCQASTEKGERCRMSPLKDSDYCWVHDPDNADAVQEARRVGGLRRRKEATVAVAYDFEGLESIAQIRRMVEVAALDALSLENSLARVRALGYLAQVATMLLEKGEHEERLEAIESVLGPKLPQNRRNDSKGRWSR